MYEIEKGHVCFHPVPESISSMYSLFLLFIILFNISGIEIFILIACILHLSVCKRSDHQQKQQRQTKNILLFCNIEQEREREQERADANAHAHTQLDLTNETNRMPEQEQNRSEIYMYREIERECNRQGRYSSCKTGTKRFYQEHLSICACRLN